MFRTRPALVSSPQALSRAHRSTRVLAASLFVTLAWFSAPTPAQANTTYGINLGGAVSILGGSEDRDDGALSNSVVEGWVGYQFPIPLLIVAAEAKLGMTSLLPTVESNATTTEDIYRASVGARLGLNSLIAPQIFAHVGWGWLSGQSDVIVTSNRGATYELGAGVDINALPFLRAGVYASLNRLFHKRKETGESSNTHWVAYGLQGTILW